MHIETVEAPAAPGHISGSYQGKYRELIEALRTQAEGSWLRLTLAEIGGEKPSTKRTTIMLVAQSAGIRTNTHILGAYLFVRRQPATIARLEQ
jgi:hypothetical protein